MAITNYEEFFPNCNIDYVKDEKHWHSLEEKESVVLMQEL